MNKSKKIYFWCVFCLAFFLLALDDYYILSQSPSKWEGFWPYFAPASRQILIDKLFMAVSGVSFGILLKHVITDYKHKALWIVLLMFPMFVGLMLAHLVFIFLFGPILHFILVN